MTEKQFIEKVRRSLKMVNFSEVGTCVIQDYDLDKIEFNNLFRCCKENILKIRGVCGAYLAKGSWTDSLVIYGKPCKEFIALQKYLKKYANYDLNVTAVSIQNISGKRGSYDIDGVEFLAHNSKRCVKILDYIKSNKSYGNTLRVKSIEHMNNSDRFNYNGEDRECEWDGCIFSGVEVAVHTASGRLKNKINIFV